VADLVADECLGLVSVMRLLEDDGTDGEIGYWTHPSARGRGVISEATGSPSGTRSCRGPTAAWATTPAPQRR
jgi:hypothetical protein